MNDNASVERSVAENLKVVEQPIATVIQTMLVGMINMTRGLPPEIVLTTIAWHTGNLAANAIGGELETVLHARKAFMEAFVDGVQKAELPKAGPQKRQ
jgi:hypothetical protein